MTGSAAQRRRNNAERKQAARSRGRFTRNFVVQGTAAEWACCWLAEFDGGCGPWRPASQDRSGEARPMPGTPQLVAFLHDEVMVHCPDTWSRR